MDNSNATKCNYCGNTAHHGIERSVITAERAEQLWSERDRASHKLALTAAECEAVKHAWEQLDGSSTFMGAFESVRRSAPTAADHTFTQLVSVFVATCNKAVEVLASEGKDPLYKEFGFSIGPKHARIYTVNRDGSNGSVRAFLGRDGFVRQAKSWKQVGRVVGSPSDCISFVVAPYMAHAKR